MKQYIPPIIKSEHDKLIYEEGVKAQQKHTEPSPETFRMFGEVKEILVRIETQTTKTNGRVTQIEKREGARELAYKYTFRAISVVAIFMVMPMMYWVVITTVETSQKLSNIEVEVILE